MHYGTVQTEKVVTNDLMKTEWMDKGDIWYIHPIYILQLS